MISIHNSSNGFHPHWINYCESKGIPYKLVNCYANNIIEQLKDCSCLLWHVHHQSINDITIGQKILFALDHTGFNIFPDIRTLWHFDDKIAQKYLLERIDAPLVPTYVFYNKKEALVWIGKTDFPKVFKLRSGAGSNNVKLIQSKEQATKLVNQAFGRGFSRYNSWDSLRERYRKYKIGDSSFKEILKGIFRLFIKPPYARQGSRERNYIYFQDFIPGNDSDIRIIVIEDKAFGIKRMVRENDFRASGSGEIIYDYKQIDLKCVMFSFEIAKKLQTQSLALDFVFDHLNNPLVVEISFGFSQEGYDKCKGYWDKDLKWHHGNFNPQGWIIDMLLNKQ